MTTRTNLRYLADIVMLAVALSAIGCGGYPEPKDAQIKSEAAVRGAQEVGASQDPQATLQLKYATDEIAQAKSLMERGENRAAELVLMRAKADAELAIALAKLRAEQHDAQDARNQVAEMKRKLGK